MNENHAPRTDAPSPETAPQSPPPADNASSLEEAPAPVGLYQIEFEGDARFVEAESMRDAIEIWKHHQALTLDLELADVDEPAGCTRIDSLPALRWPQVSAMRGRELEIDEDGCTVKWSAGELTAMQAGELPSYMISALGYTTPGELHIMKIRHSADDLLDLAAAVYVLLGVMPGRVMERPKGVAADVIDELLAFLRLAVGQLEGAGDAFLAIRNDFKATQMYGLRDHAKTLLAQADQLRREQADADEGGAA